MMEETEQQTPAPGALDDRADIDQIEGCRFRGKLLKLGVGNPAEKGSRGENGFQPCETLRPLPEVFERGLTRGIFNPGELASSGVDGDEGIQARLLGLAQGGPSSGHRASDGPRTAHD